MSQLLTINIFGQAYTFASEADTERAKAVAGQLQSEITRIEQQQSGVRSEKVKIAIVISAALNIANDNFEINKNYSDLLNNIEIQSKRLLELLEAEKIETPAQPRPAEATT